MLFACKCKLTKFFILFSICFFSFFLEFFIVAGHLRDSVNGLIAVQLLDLVQEHGRIVDCLEGSVDKSIDVDYQKGIVDSFFVNDLFASFGLLSICHPLF